MACTICGKKDHNKQTCDLRIKEKISLKKLAEEHAGGLGRSEKIVFLDLYQNKPGPGAPIQYPENAGFIDLSDLSDNQYLKDMVNDLSKLTKRNRKQCFSDIISIVHKLAPYYDVYIGRTYIREDAVQKGMKERFKSHRDKREMQYGKPLYAVGREDIESVEKLAIRFVKLWSETEKLCCNNNVLGSNGPLTEDNLQLVYICIREGGVNR